MLFLYIKESTFFLPPVKNPQTGEIFLNVCYFPLRFNCAPDFFGPCINVINEESKNQLDVT